jgi:DNA-binding NtrC family response regulator
MAKVLLIDDDVDLVEMYRLVLTHRGHTVQTAYSAADARKVLASAGRPDIAVLDVMMESQTAGIELAREIHATYPDLPMLMPSGVHEAMDVPFRLEPDQDWLPVTKFIDKPVNPERLADEIEKLVGKV